MSKILIVEDNAESRYMLEQLLASKGHHIITAENGEDALRFARQDPPEVIISDIMMPVMNGFRLCHEVKSDSTLRNIPFIFYTATFVEKADEKLAMSLGASRFIVKPTEGEQFIQILDEVLDEHRQGILHVPEEPLESEDTLLEMYDNSIARKLAETVEKLQDERKALIKSEKRLKEAQELAQIGHWELDLKSNSLECSDEIYRILGLKPQEFDASYEAFMAFVHPDDRAYVAKARKESLEKKTPYDIEGRVLLKDGTVKYVNEKFQTIYDDDGMPTCSMGTVQDITERKQAEEKLHHLNLVLHAIREVNQLIVKEKDRDALIHKTCEILIKTRGYYHAWIALMDEKGTYIISVEAGLDKDFTPMKKLLKEGKWPACAKKALNQKKLVITEEPKTECTGCPLSVNYAGCDAYTIRLEHNGRNYGLLSVSVPKSSIWDTQEHDLLREAAGDIAFALYSIEVGKERKKAEEAQREAESLYRLHFENVSDVIYSVDPELKVSSISPSVERLLGYKPEELIGRPFQELNLLAPEYLEQAASDIVRVLEGERISSAEYQFIARDATKKWGEISGTPLIKDGQVVAVVSVVRDITERKWAEKELMESEFRYKSMFYGNPSVVFIRDIENYCITDVNPAACSFYGYSREEMIGMNMMRISTTPLKKIQKYAKQTLIERKNHFFSRHKLANGEIRDVEIHNGPMTISGKAVIFSIVNDITDRKQAEEKLRHEHDFVSRIMETSPVCITMVNREGQITFANPGAEEVLGLSPDEVTGRTYNSPEWRITDFDGKPFPEEQMPFRRVMDTGLPVYDVRHAIEWPDGRRVLLSINGAPLFDNVGQIEGVICALQNMTEQIEISKALRESEEHYRTLFEQSKDPIYLTTREGEFIDVNQAFLDLFGYTKAEIKSLNAEEIYANPKERSRFKQQVEEEGFVRDFEMKNRKKDGTQIDCVVTSALQKAEDGSILGYQGFIWDITERKQAEEALKDEATRRRILVEQSRDGIAVLDQNGKVYEANQRYADLLGYSMEEVLQLHVWDWDTQFSQEQLLEMLRTVDDTGDHFETRHRKKNGTFYDVEISTNGAVYGGQKLIFCICRDITERKQAEAKIKEYADNLGSMVEERTKELNRALYDTEVARDKIDGILKSVGDGLIVTDLYNRVILMNRAAEDFLGVRLSEVIDRPIDFAIEDKTLRDQIKTTLDKKESGYQFDFELPGDDLSNPRIIRGRTSIIEDKTGKHTGIITTMNDVTYEREVDRMKTDFISTAAHELRTPLTSILGFSEVLLNQDNLPPEEKTEFLGYINTQSKSLSKIIDDLLDISRIESGRGFSISKEPCDPFRITKQVVSYYEKQSPQHQFKVMFPKKPVEIMADRDKLEQVVKNLIDNAVKYSPDGGAIRIRGKKVGNQYQVSVEDQGIGMTQEQAEKIFDKFYRAKDASFISKGTGLGMSIVKHIVEFHGGNVWVESEHGKGTTVHFTVPIGEEIGK